MNMNSIALLNIAFMLISATIAYYVPFELLLFSYAVLGPAHYLTEISWLHDRGYYTSGSRDYLSLVVMTVLMLVIPSHILNTSLSISAFVAALLMVKVRNPSARISGILIMTLIVLGLRSHMEFGDAFSVLLATILHVYFFTGAFILYGALKRRQSLDFLSLGVFILCGAAFFVFPPSITGYSVSTYVDSNTRFFEQANHIVLNILGIHERWDSIVSAMGFFAFAYTYHYLNWFSKTKIIRWHEISKKRAVLILVLYFTSIGVYALNYTLGFTVLLFLSLLHVLLEFPLNHVTFIGIARELRTLFPRAVPSPNTPSSPTT